MGEAEDAVFNLAGDEIHGGAADERGHELVGRPLVDFHRRIDLLDDAAIHEHDPVAERHGFDLVVRDIDDRGFQPHVEAGDFGPHLDAELGVEIGERLVEEEDFGFADDGSAEGNALPLAAGEFARAAVEERFDRKDGGGFTDALFDFGFRCAAHFQAERHVLVDRHVRVEGVILKDHGDVAIAGGDIVHESIADVNFAAAGFFQTGDHAERGRFAATAGTDENDELAVGDLEIHITDGVEAVGVVLIEMFQEDVGHRSSEYGELVSK